MCSGVSHIFSGYYGFVYTFGYKIYNVGTDTRSGVSETLCPAFVYFEIMDLWGPVVYLACHIMDPGGYRCNARKGGSCQMNQGIA